MLSARYVDELASFEMLNEPFQFDVCLSVHRSIRLEKKTN